MQFTPARFVLIVVIRQYRLENVFGLYAEFSDQISVA